MKKKCWKKSQSSSGFYKKEKGKLPQFIKFETMDQSDYGKKNHRVYFKKGLGSKPEKTLGYFKSKPQALAFANKYMKSQDKC